MTESNVEIARRGFAAVLSGDFEAVTEFLDADLVSVIGAGARVVVVLRPVGNDRTVANLTTFREGKAIEMVHYPSPEDAFTAAGIGS
jgi:hypothetical protein